MACNSLSARAMTRPRFLSVVLLPLAVACGEEAATETRPAAAVAPAAPAACEEGTYRTLEGTCAAYATMSLTRSPTTISPPRDHHTTIVRETAEGPYLYVFGGARNNDDILDDVQRARILPDGSLEPFEVVGKLPAPRSGHCIVDLGDRVFLAGGYMSRGVSRTTLTVGFDAAGRVADTAAGPDLPVAVMHLTCDRHGDFVYALGGRGSNDKSTTLSARVRVTRSGTASGFEAQTPLSPDRSHHASFVRGDRLYVVGGLTGNPVANAATAHKDILSAAIDASGALGAWEPAGSLPKDLSVSATLVHDDAVHVVGGLEGEWFTTAVRRATFEEDGTLTTFTTLPSKLSEARGHVHQLPTWKSFFYSVGGKNDLEESIGVVEIGRFD